MIKIFWCTRNWTGVGCLFGGTGKMNDLKYKILIVDDNTANLKILRNILVEQNYQVFIATNGISALSS